MNFLKTQGRKVKNRSFLLIFLGWLVYTTSYLGKVNYSANITQIIEFYAITKAQAGTVPTFFFFAYGVGQVFNGLFCKKYNIKWMIFGSLTVSATINFIIAVSTNFTIIKWLWLLNGFVLSILWPALVRLLSETLPKKDLGNSSVVMGTTVAAGTLIIYALSSLYAKLNKFKLSFYTAGFAVLIVSVIWLILYNSAVKEAKSESDAEQNVSKETQKITPANKHFSNKKIFCISIYILCFYSIGVNLIKDGLTTWVPSILKEEFCMTDSLSILLTLFLPILAIFGNLFAIKMHNVISDYIMHCVVVFAIIAIFVCITIVSLKFKLVIFMLVSLIVVNFFASSLNSLVTSIFPLFMRGMINSGLIAGILNGFCYVGSTISSYGLGSIADNFGWESVFWFLFGFCIITFLIWVAYVLYKHHSKSSIIS